MKFISTSKIGKLCAKGIEYPQLRLSKSCSQVIGDIADILETEHKGKRAFPIVTEHGMPKDNTVLKNNQKISKPDIHSATHSRLAALESELSALKSLLLSKEGSSLHETENRWARPDSNRRPPPCEGSFSRLEPLLSFFNPDCQLVKELQACNGREVREDSGASYRQTDCNKGLSPERTAEYSQCRVKEVPKEGLASLELQFNHDELVNYTEYRKTELTRKSADWINRASIAFWFSTYGIISAKTLTDLRKKTLAKYRCEDSKSKVLTFAVALAKTHLDIRYRSFELFLERPRRVKMRKNVTNRIVTKEDIEHVLGYIYRAECRGSISRARAEQYTAFTVFGALTGQRSMATMMKLSVGQFRESFRAPKSVLRVEPSQDKIRMEHYVPLHPQVIDAIQPLLDGRRANGMVELSDDFVL